MPIKVTCPKCQGVLHAPDDAGGKRGKCPTCGTVLSIPAIGGGSPAPMAPAAPPLAGPRPASLASMPDFGDDVPHGTLPVAGNLTLSAFDSSVGTTAEEGRRQSQNDGQNASPAVAEDRRVTG